MDVLALSTLVVIGFTACAEFGSYALVHPVIRRLPPAYHITVEQGLLRTYGRVMPPLMTLSVVLAVVNAARAGGEGGSGALRWAAAGSLAAALISTLVVNVPINLATARWEPAAPPEDWQATRHRWEFFQGVRSWLFLLGFVLTSAGFATGQP